MRGGRGYRLVEVASRRAPQQVEGPDAGERGHDHHQEVAEGRAHRSVGGEGHGRQHHQAGVAGDLDARQRGLGRGAEAGARGGDAGPEPADEERGEEGEGDQGGDGAAGGHDQQQDHDGDLGQGHEPGEDLGVGYAQGLKSTEVWRRSRSLAAAAMANTAATTTAAT